MIKEVCRTYIKLNSQIVDSDLNSSRHWVSLSHTVKHYVNRGLSGTHFILGHYILFK